MVWEIFKLLLCARPWGEWACAQTQPTKALWVSGKWALLVFKARCFGGSSLTRRSLKLRCLMWGTNLLLLRGAPDCESSPDYGWLWRGVGFMVRLHFSLPYLPPDLFLLCSFEEIIQLVFRSFSQRIFPFVAVDSLCPWENVSSRSSYAGILNHLQYFFFSLFFPVIFWLNWYFEMTSVNLDLLSLILVILVITLGFIA